MPDDENTYALHAELADNTTLLLRIKDYYTNLGSDVGDRHTIEHSHNLWHVQ